jgi:RND family efflux transporter MFP subunit
MRKTMNARWMISVLALAALACGGDGQAAEENASAPVAVRSAPVTSAVLARPIVSAGTVTPRDEISLSFTIGGVIERIAVDAGDVVRAGQLLATLDLREINAGLTKARSAAEKAERDLARTRRLYADSVVTLAQMQDAETAAEIARADRDAAAFNRRYSVIVAPANGSILRRAAEPGETVTPGSTILILGSRARGTVVEVGLPDRDAAVVREGDLAVARFDAIPDMEFRGRVVQIAAAADAGTGTYTVEVSLEEAGDLAAGLVGQVEIKPSRGAPTTLVPIEAVLEADGGQATVYALSSDGTRAERRRVTVAFIDGDRVAVARGLEGVTAVLTDGAAYVDEGTVVRVSP